VKLGFAQIVVFAIFSAAAFFIISCERDFCMPSYRRANGSSDGGFTMRHKNPTVS
jgi:hypothetical protein